MTFLIRLVQFILIMKDIQAGAPLRRPQQQKIIPEFLGKAHLLVPEIKIHFVN
jgi:hypothetical protein